MASSKCYAYYIEEGSISGIVESWGECEMIVKGQKARYKGFKSQQEAQAWLNLGATYDAKLKVMKNKSTGVSLTLKKGLYFDAGTGRGIGTEVRVVNEKGVNQLEKVVPSEKINPYGNYTTEGKTNNFGELLGCYIALKIALNEEHHTIFGDSKLVLEYWSKGRYNKNNLKDSETIELIERVAKLRAEFEVKGGEVLYISGDDNPADLGFHK